MQTAADSAKKPLAAAMELNYGDSVTAGKADAVQQWLLPTGSKQPHHRRD